MKSSRITFLNFRATLKGMGVWPPKIKFCSFLCMLQLYLSSIQNGVIWLTTIKTFRFTSSYVKSVFQNIGKMALYRTNGHFQHKLAYQEKTTSQIEPNFFIMVDVKVIQKLYSAIFKFLFFAIFQGVKVQIFVILPGPPLNL